MIVKTVVPEVDPKRISEVMRLVFEQYDICKVTQGNPERKAYVEAVEAAVEALNEYEKIVITARYLIDFHRSDLNVYTRHLDPPISKDAYVKIRNRAFQKLFLTLIDKGIVSECEGKEAK